MFCFTLALVLALLPLTRFSYTWIDYDPTLGSGHCSYFSLESIPRHTSTADFSADEARRAVIAGLLYCWMTYFGWVALTIGYCVLVIGTVIYRLWTERQRTLRLITQRSQRISTSNDDISNTDTPILVFVRCLESIEIWQVAKKILRRVAQFPATIIMCHTLEVVWATVTLSRIIPLFKTGDPGTTGDLKRLYVAMQIMLSIQGIVTLLSMCFEPAVNELVVEWWKHWNLYRDPEYKSHVSRDNSATQSATQDSGAHLNPSLLPRSLESMPWDIAILNPK
ncbi:hypothetical protein GGI05_006083 [Coemansia sp. RSA 2603]|nr:hypothetical protein GGI05_006083 [Coemansia sp. RSA 2603]